MDPKAALLKAISAALDHMIQHDPANVLEACEALGAYQGWRTNEGFEPSISGDELAEILETHLANVCERQFGIDVDNTDSGSGFEASVLDALENASEEQGS